MINCDLHTQLALQLDHVQVVSLRLRSSNKVGQAVLSEEQEIDYSLKMNKELPPDIRVLGWATVPADFSARHAQPPPHFTACTACHNWHSVHSQRTQSWSCCCMYACFWKGKKSHGNLEPRTLFGCTVSSQHCIKRPAKTC